MNPLHAIAIEEEKEGAEDVDKDSKGSKYALLRGEEPIDLQSNVLNPLADLDAASLGDSGEKASVIGLQRIDDGEEEDWGLNKASPRGADQNIPSPADDMGADRLQQLNQQMESAIAKISKKD